MYEFNNTMHDNFNLSKMLFPQQDFLQKSSEEEVPCKKFKSTYEISDEENTLEPDVIYENLFGNAALGTNLGDAFEVNTQVAFPQIETNGYLHTLYTNTPPDDQYQQLQLTGEVLLNYNGQVKREEEIDGNFGSPRFTQNSTQIHTQRFHDFGLTNKYQPAVLNPDGDQNDTKSLSPVESSSDGKISSVSGKVEKDKDGDTILHIFIAKCDDNTRSCADTLLDNAFQMQPYVNVQDNSGQTPLHLAIEVGNEHLINVLLTWGACLNIVNKRMESPIHSALHLKSSISQNPEKVTKIVGMLLNANNKHYIPHEKLDLQSKNSKGYAPVHLATMRGDFELVKLLKKFGANLNDKERRQGLTPLLLAIINGRDAREQTEKESWFKFAKMLITQLHVGVNEASLAGDTPLHLACLVNSEVLVETLLNSNADVNIKNIFKKTEKDLTTIQTIKDLIEVKYRQKRRKRKIERNN